MAINNSLKLILLFAFFATQCKNTPQKSSSIVNEPMFYLKTTECMGSCPVFTFTVFDGGLCSYQGIDNVDKLGTYSSELSLEQVDELKNKLSTLDFFNLEVKNNMLVKDLPSQYLYYNDGENEKTIMYYHPKNKQLDELIEFTNSLIIEMEWTKK